MALAAGADPPWTPNGVGDEGPAVDYDAVTIAPSSGRVAVGAPLGTAGPTDVGEDAPTQLKPPPDPSSPRRSGGDDVSAGPLRIGQDFGARYHIIRLLGLGGMGAVYQAWDKALEIVVALKVIRPEAAADPESAQELDRRFKRELLLAREVTHKNVVRIHDLGEIDDIKYITMSFVEGEDLRSILAREGKIPVDRALRILRGIVAGLGAAHEAGVVHRDLKPANIMVNPATDDACIMDFGIARSTGGAASTEIAGVAGLRQPVDRGETVAGSIVGTVAYMAPEQAMGKVVDQRADQYALGLIAYDMLLGTRRPSHAASALEEIQRRIEHAPPPLRALDPSVPEALERLISRCLEPDPEARFASTGELAAELDRLDANGQPLPVKRHLTAKSLTAAAAVVAVLIAGTWWLAGRRGPVETPAPMSVLIADFENSTGDAAFDDALEQALAIGMEGASFISAYPRARAQRVVEELKAGAPLDEGMARLVSRREGIDAVLAGRIELSGRRFKVSVRALDPAREPEDRPLASASASANERDAVLPAIGKLAAELRRDLGDTEPESARLAASETFTASSPEAMNSYAHGQDLLFLGKWNEALAAYREATDRDPALGRAWAGMGTVYGNLKDQPKAEESFQLALRHLDRMTEREKLRTLGAYYLLVSRNYDKAIETYRELVEAFPADRAGHANLAYTYQAVRDFARAMEEGKAAIELEPGNALQRVNYAIYALSAGEFETSMEEAGKALEANPGFGYALFTLARAAVGAGRNDAAREAYGRLPATDSVGAALAVIGESDLDMYQGRYQQALERLRQADSAAGASSDGYAAERQVIEAEALFALGRKAEAKAAILRAIESSRQESVVYPAARLLLALDEPKRAEQIAADLDNRLQTHTSAMAGLLRGESSLRAGRLSEALEALRAARDRYDFWFAHYLLGRVYVEAGHFPEAIDELELCLTRKGEALDVFLADSSTARYLPPVHYWLGRAQEGLGDPENARRSYAAYLELRGAADAPDPLAEEARRRLSPAS